VVNRSYFTRQVVTLLKFAKSTSDPKVVTALVDKASTRQLNSNLKRMKRRHRRPTEAHAHRTLNRPSNSEKR
jgi:hypothetical protein